MTRIIVVDQTVALPLTVTDRGTGARRAACEHDHVDPSTAGPSVDGSVRSPPPGEGSPGPPRPGRAGSIWNHESIETTMSAVDRGSANASVHAY